MLPLGWSDNVRNSQDGLENQRWKEVSLHERLQLRWATVLSAPCCDERVPYRPRAPACNGASILSSVADLHLCGRGYKPLNACLKSLCHAWEHGGATSEDNIQEQIRVDIRVTLHDSGVYELAHIPMVGPMVQWSKAAAAAAVAAAAIILCR